VALPGSVGSATPSASAEPTSSASPSAKASKTPSPSATRAIGGDAGDDSDDGTVVSVPEPPAGASMRTVGFGLMAVGVFGLAVLGIYVMRRGGFFAV
jgi:hypothetical protein